MCDPMQLMPQFMALGLFFNTIFQMDQSTLISLHPGHSYPVSATMHKLQRKHCGIWGAAFPQELLCFKIIHVIDRKPLVAILGFTKGIPSLAAARLLLWVIILLEYFYEIELR